MTIPELATRGVVYAPCAICGDSGETVVRCPATGHYFVPCWLCEGRGAGVWYEIRPVGVREYEYREYAGHPDQLHLFGE